MRRKPKIKYTDMCIYIDEHIHEEGHDAEKIYDYLVMVSYMLAIKQNLFNEEEYYDKFSMYLANIVYMRMVDKRQYLPEDDPNYIAPIKSCLNYIKSIIRGKKVAFSIEEFNSTTPPVSRDSEIVKDYLHSTVFMGNRDLLACDINLYLKTIDKILYKYIYEGVYGNDKLLAWKLYTSCLISLLRNFTLSNKNKMRLIDLEMTKEQYKLTGKKHIYYKDNYTELMSDCISSENESAPIVYDLGSEYLDYVAVILQKVKIAIMKDIQELSDEYDVSDEMITDILLAECDNSEED